VSKTKQRARGAKQRTARRTRPPQYPQRRNEPSGAIAHAKLWLPLVVVMALAVGGAFLLSSLRDNSPPTPLRAGERAAGLPNTPDYHSLLVAPNDSMRIFLGTHGGLFETTDGGMTWAQASLVDKDAMNLARTPGKTIWAAGHGVLAKSTDGGANWQEVSPPGLPYLDVHGFAADPSDPQRLWAAIAGEGLFRSIDGGASFELVSKEVGPDVFGLAVLPGGTILAGDTMKGLLTSADGGKRWRRVLEEPIVGLAVNPRDPRTVLAAGSPGVYRSTDGGRTWALALAINGGGGPVAWSPSEPDVAYAVGFDRSFRKSSDRGRSWQTVAPSS
jgi:photosystem II stability/assembly factor-like uncharacterized protein